MGDQPTGNPAFVVKPAGFNIPQRKRPVSGAKKNTKTASPQPKTQASAAAASSPVQQAAQQPQPPQQQTAASAAAPPLPAQSAAAEDIRNVPASDVPRKSEDRKDKRSVDSSSAGEVTSSEEDRLPSKPVGRKLPDLKRRPPGESRGQQPSSQRSDQEFPRDRSRDREHDHSGGHRDKYRGDYRGDHRGENRHRQRNDVDRDNRDDRYTHRSSHRPEGRNSGYDARRHVTSPDYDGRSHQRSGSSARKAYDARSDDPSPRDRLLPRDDWRGHGGRPHDITPKQDAVEAPLPHNSRSTPRTDTHTNRSTPRTDASDDAVRSSRAHADKHWHAQDYRRGHRADAERQNDRGASHWRAEDEWNRAPSPSDYVQPSSQSLAVRGHSKELRRTDGHARDAAKRPRDARADRDGVYHGQREQHAQRYDDSRSRPLQRSHHRNSSTPPPSHGGSSHDGDRPEQRRLSDREVQNRHETWQRSGRGTSARERADMRTPVVSAPAAAQGRSAARSSREPSVARSEDEYKRDAWRAAGHARAAPSGIAAHYASAATQQAAAAAAPPPLYGAAGLARASTERDALAAHAPHASLPHGAPFASAALSEESAPPLPPEDTPPPSHADTPHDLLLPAAAPVMTQPSPQETWQPPPDYWTKDGPVPYSKQFCDALKCNVCDPGAFEKLGNRMSHFERALQCALLPCILGCHVPTVCRAAQCHVF